MGRSPSQAIGRARVLPAEIVAFQVAVRFDLRRRQAAVRGDAVRRAQEAEEREGQGVVGRPRKYRARRATPAIQAACHRMAKFHQHLLATGHVLSRRLGRAAPRRDDRAVQLGATAPAIWPCSRFASCHERRLCAAARSGGYVERMLIQRRGHRSPEWPARRGQTRAGPTPLRSTSGIAARGSARPQNSSTSGYPAFRPVTRDPARYLGCYDVGERERHRPERTRGTR